MSKGIIDLLPLYYEEAEIGTSEVAIKTHTDLGSKWHSDDRHTLMLLRFIDSTEQHASFARLIVDTLNRYGKAPPTKEVLEFIRWAIYAAESEFYLPADDRTDLNASLKWLEQFSSSPCDSEAEHPCSK